MVNAVCCSDDTGAMMKRLSVHIPHKEVGSVSLCQGVEVGGKVCLPISLVKGDGNVCQKRRDLIAYACPLNLLPGFAHGLERR